MVTKWVITYLKMEHIGLSYDLLTNLLLASWNIQVLGGGVVFKLYIANKNGPGEPARLLALGN